MSRKEIHLQKGTRLRVDYSFLPFEPKDIIRNNSKRNLLVGVADEIGVDGGAFVITLQRFERYDERSGKIRGHWDAVLRDLEEATEVPE